MAIYELNSCVRGYHVYRKLWKPSIGRKYLCRRDPDNKYDPFAVAVMNNASIVGYVPRKFSDIISPFLMLKETTLSCKVTGEEQVSLDLPQSGIEIPCTYIFSGRSKDILVLQRDINRTWLFN